MSNPSPLKIETYFEAWSSSLCQLLTQLSGPGWKSEIHDPPQDHGTATGIRVEASGGLSGCQWLYFGQPELRGLVRLLFPQEVPPGEAPPEVLAEALQELCRQWCGLAAAGLEAAFGEVHFAAELEKSIDPPIRVSRSLTVTGEQGSFAVILGFDASIFAALDRRAPGNANPALPNTSADAMPTKNLDLLLDLELGVRIRFGKRQMQLREVVEMVSGMVLELDRKIHEPVDLLLNDRVIAQGEIVVLDGEYGFRVSEVATAVAGVPCQ